MDIRQQLLAAFEVEHREHLDAIRAALAAEGGVDWHDVFRRAHSLKGAARAVDLPPVEAVAHQLEALFERINAGQHPLDREARAATHLALDRIEAFVAAGAAAAMPDDALAALAACLDPAAPKPASEPEPAPEPAPAPSSAPAPEPAGDPSLAVLRVPATAVEALTRASHGLWAALPGQAVAAERATRFATQVRDLRRRAEAAQRAGGTASLADAAGLRRALADLEAGLGALTREAADLALGSRAANLAVETAAARVREEAERLALVPAETVFGGLARMVRDLARAEGRDVEVSARGLDLPVERMMLQSLKDPVLHALRNALSHGAETPEARRRAGKPPALSILLSVEALGGRLVLGIHDDGRGPDLAAIAATARARGLIAPGEEPDADALLALPFEPGFSTTGTVDALSGRGMGLSVVAEVARALHGQVRLAARVPHGTSLILTLPLSAARRPVVIVEAGGARYALPSGAVEALTRIDPEALETVAGRPVVPVEGDGERAGATLPVASLSTLLGVAEAARDASTVPALRLRGAQGRCLLTVEHLHDVRRLLVLPAPPFGVDPALVTGTVVLGTATPALVLDPDGLIARLGHLGPRPSLERMKPYNPADGTMVETRRSTILVVDDSITTRTLEKSILEAAGYRVIVCVDGQEALDRLRARIEPVDLVVADVEMPRLDGFGLVASLRREEEFARLPVVLMTSRGDEADVARGLELGADAYLTKQKFDQRELLDTIGQLL